MAAFVILRHPVTILVTAVTNQYILTNDLLLLKLLFINVKCRHQILWILFNMLKMLENQYFEDLESKLPTEFI